MKARVARVVREVLISHMAGWVRVRASQVVKDGWLQYELADGTCGLAQPKNWRLVDAKTGAEHAKTQAICTAQSPTYGRLGAYCYCTRERGHDGNHVATTLSGEVVATWAAPTTVRP